MDLIAARFDSLTGGPEGRSFVFRELVDEVVATVTTEVVPALERIDRAASSGLHAAGFIGYEAGPGLDPALAALPAAPGWPLLHFGIFRRREEVPPLAGLPEARAAYQLGTLVPSIDQSRYAGIVRRILELIAAGDTYQVNFTLRLRGSFAGDARSLYRDLCLAQRSAFCAYLETESRSILSASPELFFRRRGDLIEMRPMKGTRPRGRWSEEDAAIARSLLDSGKDRAENLMIVDLLRNDLGRVAEFGTVAVPRLFEVERYPTVHQMTSTVTARCRVGIGLVELMRATFPSGSVTGAPKIRTSQIIRELEESPRGPYTGAIGFVSPGESVFSVAIRTVCLADGKAEVGVGSGITADSEPVQEYEESLGKGTFVSRRTPRFELVETLRLEASGAYPLLDLHLQRIAASASYFSFPLDIGAARQALLNAAEAANHRLQKVRLRMDERGAIQVELEPIPLVTPPSLLGLAAEPVDERDPFLYHKTTNRAWIDAGGGVPPGLDDVLFWNSRGELTESTRANVVLDLDGELVTPPIESGLLPGVMRRRLIEESVIRERVLTTGDLGRARRILLINAVRGVWEGHLPRG